MLLARFRVTWLISVNLSFYISTIQKLCSQGVSSCAPPKKTFLVDLLLCRWSFIWDRFPPISVNNPTGTNKEPCFCHHCGCVMTLFFVISSDSEKSWSDIFTNYDTAWLWISQGMRVCSENRTLFSFLVAPWKGMRVCLEKSENPAYTFNQVKQSPIKLRSVLFLWRNRSPMLVISNECEKS